MYPFLRMGADLWRFRNAPQLGLFGTHVTSHRIWPWDLDIFMELNNGRTLTLYDIARVGLAQRSGLWPVLRRQGWTMTLAGVSVRFRRRVKVFHTVESRARIAGWDRKFFYLDQSMWREGECTSHIMVRLAVTDVKGLVAPDRVLAELGVDTVSPPLTPAIEAWIEAEDRRPWPPE